MGRGPFGPLFHFCVFAIFLIVSKIFFWAFSLLLLNTGVDRIISYSRHAKLHQGTLSPGSSGF
jgi:hypothetical protein